MAVLKIAVGKLTGGSNPSLSANSLLRLSARTSGFHPEKTGSTPVGGANLNAGLAHVGRAEVL